ncbi:ribbon-helix-helix domain-containing protein [Methylobacterium brachiatum]
MTVRRSITVSITPEQDDLIRSCLRFGRFASTSEVVRAALRLLDREEATTPSETQAKREQGDTARA